MSRLRTSRRSFLTGLGATALGAALPMRRQTRAGTFNVSVLTDEISQDFGHACEVASGEFGLGWVELRAMHNKNVMNWDQSDIADVRKILERFKLRVSEIASPVFKTDWPGAPRSPFSPKTPQFGADFTYEQQDELLDRAMALAKTFDTPYIRVFDFWRLDDPAPYRQAIDDRVRQAAVKAAAKGLVLTLENELACNTATGRESARLLNAVTEPGLMLNWDPGNATARGEKAYPIGYEALPKNRIRHVHCKDVFDLGNGKTDWAPMGKGVVDWLGQFRALKTDGYAGALSLETHWRLGGSTPEESTRQSLAGMKALLRQADK